MATELDFEPMDQDCEEGGDTLQVQVTNDLFKTNTENEDELDFEADDLEITEFLKTDERHETSLNKSKTPKGKKEKAGDALDGQSAESPVENITISVIGPNGDEESAKEDGEISETQSQSNGSNVEDDNVQYFSRSSSLRSSRRRNDIRRERSPVARRYPNPYLEFDDEKIQSRALRFGLANSTTATTGVSSDKIPQISDEDRLNLYISCGLIQDDGGKLTLDKVAPHYRLDSILIRGTNHMNTNEIFKYLYDLGHKPVAMEWVNDAMCVAIYENQFDAAASLLKTSKPIMMDPRLVERKRSIIQSTENDKEDDEKSEQMNEDFDYDKVDAIPQSWITVPMPPGYVWRLGAPCEKAKGILVRFANKQDKKQERAERFSEYYQKYGNPNKVGSNRENTGANENVRRRRKKIRSEQASFESDRKEKEEASYRESQIKTANPNDKNGWGQLSAMWDDEEAFQRSARDRMTTARQRSKDGDNSPQSGVSPMKRPETTKDATPSTKAADARDLLKSRQKRKRGTNSSDEEEGDSDSDNGDNERFGLNERKDGSYRRKRNSKLNEDDDDGDNIAWRERLSGPRMRMHADEEEERMKRRAFRRLGQKRVNDTGLQTNPWEFSRDSSSNSFRSKVAAQTRRPISERLGAKRNVNQNAAHQDNAREDNDVGLNNQGGFDLRQKLINMRRMGNEDASSDEEEDLHNLIFYGND